MFVVHLSVSKFWTRNRPGDKMRDRYNLNLLPGMSEDGLEYGELQEDKKHTSGFICSQLCVTVPVWLFQMTWT